MISPKFRGTVTTDLKPKLVIQQQDLFDRQLQSLQGLDVEIIIRRYQSPKDLRSQNQNRYYWGVIVKLIASATGFTDEETHEALKWKFLIKHGSKLDTVGRTRDLDTTEFEEYMRHIREFAAAELNCYIPEPNEADYK